MPLLAVAPGDVVAAIVWREVNAIGLVVRGDDDAADVEHVVLAQVLFIASEHVGRCGRVTLHMVVELIAVEIAKVARLADPEAQSI